MREITEAQSGSLDFFLLHDIETTDESGCHSTVYELSFTAMNTPSYILAKYSTDCFLHSIDNHNTMQYSMSGATLPGYGLALATESIGAQTCLEPYSLQTIQIPLLPGPKEDPLGQPSTCQHSFSVLSANPFEEWECTIKCKQ